MKEFLTTIGIESGYIIAGLIGSVAGSKGSKKPFLAKLGSIITGIGVSVYTAPLACDLLNVVNEKSKLGVAVAIGYTGIQGIQRLLISRLKGDGEN